MMRNWGLICRLHHHRASCLRSVSSSYHFTEARKSPPIAVSSTNGTPERPFSTVSSFSSSLQFHPSNLSPQCPRTFSSSSAGARLFFVSLFNCLLCFIIAADVFSFRVLLFCSLSSHFRSFLSHFALPSFSRC